MLYQFKAIFKKEWRDMWRDRRTVTAAMSYAIVGPLLLGFIIQMIADSDSKSDTPNLAVIGSNLAPGLVSYLKNNQVTISQEPRTELEPTIPKGADAILVIPTDYQKKISEFKAPHIMMYVEKGSQDRALASRKLVRIIHAYSGKITNDRMLARGIAPAIMNSLNIQVADTSKTGMQGKQLGDLMLLYFMLAPFFASMAVAIDITAGERERNSLQALLAQPVDSRTLVMGKWAVAASFGLVGTLITIGLGAIILMNSPLGALGIRLHLDLQTLALAAFSLLPLVALVSALQMLVALYAKSFKEGQTYLTMLSFLPAMIGMYRSLKGEDTVGIKAHLPIYSDLETLTGLFINGEWSLMVWLPSALLTLGLAMAAIYMSAKQLDNERMLAVS